ncbi:50S ribosomal protein L32 [bacterium 3DAC]|nr:50S ribosomal protein L32 [Dictyoglomota bacterium]UZN22711.1 50S ribosomal protein L32 [bacterium 3DAC]
MGVPKKKPTRRRARNRRAHWTPRTVTLARCPNCGALVPAHMVCPECGYYKGRQYIKVEKSEK